jgi:transcriptional regulator with XRE-family HTH domain
MLDARKIGRRIVDLRRAAGIERQEDLAARLAVRFETSRSAIAGLEAGRDLPGREMAVALANLFRVPLDYLLGRTVPPGGPLVGEFIEDPDELALIRFWRSLETPEERRLLARMMANPPPKR